MSDDLFLFAGEKSGDMHGSRLLKALKRANPALTAAGVGGPEMRSQGINSLLNTEDFEVIGFTDVLLNFPKLIKQFRLVRDHILISMPKAVVLIDYPGFNLRLASALRRKGFQGKIVQYISPSVWAWGKGRIDRMAEALDLLLTIYPFEKRCFERSSLNVQFVGNPIKEYIEQHTYAEQWKDEVGIPDNAPLISLFPGSRESEIKRNLSLQLEAAALLKAERPDLRFAISCGHSKTPEFIQKAPINQQLIPNQDLFLVPKKYSYEMMRDSHCAIAKSGTVTLELALHGRPTVVMYKTSGTNRFFIKHVVKPSVSHFCIVNIMAGKEVFPELIAHGLTSENLYRQLKRLNENSPERQQCLEECEEVRQSLDIPDASVRAADAIGKILSCRLY